MQKKKKVLHIIASMGYGGIQTWAVDLVKEAEKSDVQMDFLVYADADAPLAKLSEKHGAKIFHCPEYRNIFKLFKVIKSLNETRGPYDAVHAHNLFQNGLSLLCAKILGISVRISHSHNSGQEKSKSILRRIYNGTMVAIMPYVSTHMLAVSDVAGRKLFGKYWGKDPRCGLLYCGVNFDNFNPSNDTDGSVKASLGIPEGAKVIGHVGRFHYQKNHTFLLDAVAHAMHKDKEIWLVLVGDGELRAEIEAKAAALGIEERTIFAGLRSDVDQLMVSCFDLFFMPSHFEGLPIVMLEAQGAGNQILISDVITEEADLVPDFVHRLSLNDDASVWGDKICEILSTSPSISREEAHEFMQESPFSAKQSFLTCRALWLEKSKEG